METKKLKFTNENIVTYNWVRTGETDQVNKEG